MPGFDGTGPMGGGPITGRGRGFCISPLRRDTLPNFSRSPGYRFLNRFGYGFRRGMGGRRQRWW